MRILLMTCVVSATYFVAPHAHGQVKSSVFDDVKIWYKGSAGNAIGTSDTGTPPYGTSSGGRTDWFNKMKNLAAFATADMSSGANGLHDSAHGGKYFWWAWRMQYDNQKVDCPYAGCTLDSTPCMIVPKAKDGSGNLGPTGYSDVTVNGVTTNLPYYTEFRFGGLYFNNWMSDWASDTVCSNYTCVLRFRSDMVNPASGNGNKIIESCIIRCQLLEIFSALQRIYARVANMKNLRFVFDETNTRYGSRHIIVLRVCLR